MIQKNIKNQDIVEKKSVNFKSGRGNMIFFEKEDYSILERLASSLLSLDKIASFWNIDRKTLKNIIARDKLAEKSLNRGRLKSLEETTNLLFEQARDGNVTAQIFILKSRGGWNDKDYQDVMSEDRVNQSDYANAREFLRDAINGKINPSQQQINSAKALIMAEHQGGKKEDEINQAVSFYKNDEVLSLLQ